MDDAYNTKLPNSYISTSRVVQFELGNSGDLKDPTSQQVKEVTKNYSSVEKTKQMMFMFYFRNDISLTITA